jgi:hypothetical protein
LRLLLLHHKKKAYKNDTAEHLPVYKPIMPINEKVFKAMTSKFTMLAVTFVMMALVIQYERRAFVAHVFGVTYQLLIVLVQLNCIYGQIENSNLYFFYFVVMGGIVHAFVPVIGLFYSIFMFVHVGFCFTVHILHMADCYMIFKDLKVSDTGYIVILISVNIMEFITNLAYMFPSVVSDRGMVLIFLSVQLMALLLSVLKVKRKNVKGRYVMKVCVSPESDQYISSHNNESSDCATVSTRVVTTFTKTSSAEEPDLECPMSQEKDISSDDATPPPHCSNSVPSADVPVITKPTEIPPDDVMMIIKPHPYSPSLQHQEWVVEMMTSRLVLVSFAELTVLLCMSFPTYQYGSYLCGLGIFFAIIVAKCDHCQKSIDDFFLFSKFLGIVCLFVVLAILTFAEVIPLIASVSVSVLCTALLAAYAFHSLSGVNAVSQSTAHIMGCFLLSLPAQIAILMDQSSGFFVTEFFMCICFAYALITCTLKIKVKPYRK